MKVGVFTSISDGHHNSVLTSFYAGLLASGVDAFREPVDRYRPCDVAVVFGVAKHAVPASRHRGSIIELHEKLSKPVIVIDSGYVKRDKYFMVGLNGLNGRADFKNQSCPSDRWESLGVELRPWREDGGYVLVCGQIPWDASVQDTNHQAWCHDTINRLGQTTTKEIKFRPHPKFAPVPLPPLDDELSGAHAVVTYSSNSAVDAALAGVPVFADDIGSMAWPIANKSFAWIDAPVKPDRQQWANNLAYTQWTRQEMQEGTPWQHLMH